MKKIGVFSSHSHVVSFVKTELMIADAIYKKRIRPVIIKPSQCTCKELLFSEKPGGFSKECNVCKSNDYLLKITNPGYLFSSLNIDKEYRIIEYKKEIDELLSKPYEKLLSFKYDNVEIGKIAQHDLILKHKISDISLSDSPSLKNEYLNIIIACFLTTARFKKYLEVNKDIIAIYVYNNHYSLNRCVTTISHRYGLRTYTLHNGPSLAFVEDTLMISGQNNFEHGRRCSEAWENGYSEYVLTSEQINKTSGHVFELLEGKAVHAYSSPAGSSPVTTILNNSGDWKDKKIILVATSSPDELLATESSGVIKYGGKYLFETQIEWINFLIGKAKENPELIIIIRVHPREFPNKREGVKSENAHRLEKIFEHLPSNVVINWPSQNISIYDLIPNVDIVLTFWSTVGLEASIFGCPIIIPENPICAYNAVADKISDSMDGYWEDILDGVTTPWNLNRVIKTFRWMWLNQFGGTVSLVSKRYRKRSFMDNITSLLNSILGKLGKSHIGSIYNTKLAYHGNGQQIQQRPTDFEGEDLIRKFLIEGESLELLFHKNHDSRCEINVKSIDYNQVKDEAESVKNILNSIFKLTGVPKKLVLS
jgi:hypothetical protein